MIVVLERGTQPEQVAEVVAALEKRGLKVAQVRAGGKPVLHVVEGNSKRARRVLALDEVEGLVPTSGPRIRREGKRFFPYYFIQWTALGMVMLGVLAGLAGQFPPGIGVPVDVRNAPAELEQPWYLRAPLAFLALFPRELVWLGWTLGFGIALLVVLVPRLDRSEGRSLRGRWLVLAIVVGAAVVSAFPLLAEVLR